MNVKQFLSKIKSLNINAKLSQDRTFVIYEPSLPSDLIQFAIDIADDIILIILEESKLLSEEDKLSIDLFKKDGDISEYTSFNLTEQMNDEEENLPVVYEEYNEQSFNDDFDYVRHNMKHILKNGTKALERMLTVAKESQHPRSYEVVATLIKTLSDTNKDLLDSHKKKIEVSQINNTPISNTTNNQQINQNVFIGSTAELSKFLKNQGKDV